RPAPDGSSPPPRPPNPGKKATKGLVSRPNDPYHAGDQGPRRTNGQPEGEGSGVEGSSLVDGECVARAGGVQGPRPPDLLPGDRRGSRNSQARVRPVPRANGLPRVRAAVPRARRGVGRHH